MPTFTLTIDTDNAAFEDGAGDEIARICRDVAGRVEGLANTDFRGGVSDFNGNTVGRFQLAEKAFACPFECGHRTDSAADMRQHFDDDHPNSIDEES